jgi:hypothetical protein
MYYKCCFSPDDYGTRYKDTGLQKKLHQWDSWLKWSSDCCPFVEDPNPDREPINCLFRQTARG